MVAPAGEIEAGDKHHRQVLSTNISLGQSLGQDSRTITKISINQ